MSTTPLNLQVVPWQPNAAAQTQTITLAVDGASLTLTLTIVFNRMAGYWVMTIEDTNGGLLLDSIPLITGCYPAANLLGQFGYLKIGSCFILSTNSNPPTDYPGATNLGTDFQMIWGDTAPGAA